MRDVSSPTGRSLRAPVPVGADPARRAFLCGAAAFGLTVPLRALPVAAPGDGAAPSPAWDAYTRALLRDLCAALDIDYAAFTRDPASETAAALARRAARPVLSPIAQAGARQGLPGAIDPGAAS